MARSLPKVASRAKRKKVLKQAKGYSGRRSIALKTARQAVEKAGEYAYRDRRQRKRQFRRLWISRINAAARLNGMTYSQFMNGMKLAEIDLDRKVLSDLAVNDAPAFAALAAQSQKALEKKAA